MDKSKHSRRYSYLINKQQRMPISVSILIFVAILCLLSMIFYFISGALGNLIGLRDMSIAAEEETREFSSPIFQRESSNGTANTANEQR
ncbi:MAG TPA: hypothetical protein VLF20_00380 [Patescibacteria group bacterium]|nr:hypothetical protein [Patescibacteria group bacterium]